VVSCLFRSYTLNACDMMCKILVHFSSQTLFGWLALRLFRGGGQILGPGSSYRVVSVCVAFFVILNGGTASKNTKYQYHSLHTMLDPTYCTVCFCWQPSFIIDTNDR